MNEIQPDQAQQWFEVDKKIKLLRKSTIDAFWKMIALLKLIRDQGGWEAIGYDSFKEYVENEDLSFRYSTVCNYIATYEHLETIGCLAQGIPYSKIALIAHHLTPENSDEWLDKAKSLSWRDLYIYTKEHKKHKQAREDSDRGEPIAVEADLVWSHGKVTINIPPEKIDTETLKGHYEYYKKNFLPRREQNYIAELIQYLTEKLDTGGVANWGKQARYIKQIKQAGYSVELTKKAIDRMLEDDFWRERGFDFKNLADHIHKVVSKIKGKKKYEAADGTIFYDKDEAMAYIKKLNNKK